MNNSIIESVLCAIVGAAGKYGSDLLADAAPADPDETLRLARNLLLRIRISPEYGEGIVDAAEGVVEHPDAADRIDVLRGALALAITEDRDLASDLAITMS
jgi:hypothetical protein